MTSNLIWATTKAVAAAGNYTIGDVISESATVGTPWIWTLPQDIKRILKAILVVETASQTHSCSLLLFRSDPRKWATPPMLNDNVANTAPLNAHYSELIGVIDFPNLRGLGTGASFSVATPGSYGNLPEEVGLEPSTGKLYGILIDNTGHTDEVATDDYNIGLVGE